LFAIPPADVGYKVYSSVLEDLGRYGAYPGDDIAEGCCSWYGEGTAFSLYAAWYVLAEVTVSSVV
jgi:hypothetical protein